MSDHPPEPHRRPSVVLVGPSPAHFGPIEEGLLADGAAVRRFASEAEFRAAAPAFWAGTDLICALGSVRVDAALLGAAPRLRAVTTPYAGTEGFDRAAASARGVIVAHGDLGESMAAMAEATILLILAGLYDLHGRAAHLRTNAPGRPPPGRMLAGKTIGIIGFGRIAAAVAERLAPWGVEIQATTRRPEALPPGVAPARLDDLLASSDVICILAALNEETRGLLDAARLARIKPGAVLVNVARGAILDEAALIAEAQTGRFGALALDVFETEPLPPDSALRDLQNAILTPHAIGHTEEANRQMPIAALATIRQLLAGRVPGGVCNPEVLPAWRERWGRSEGEE